MNFSDVLWVTQSVKQEPTVQVHWKEVEESKANNFSLQMSDLHSQ